MIAGGRCTLKLLSRNLQKQLQIEILRIVFWNLTKSARKNSRSRVEIWDNIFPWCLAGCPVGWHWTSASPRDDLFDVEFPRQCRSRSRSMPRSRQPCARFFAANNACILRRENAFFAAGICVDSTGTERDSGRKESVDSTRARARRSDGYQRGDRPNFGGLALGCIEAKFCKYYK